MLYVYCGVGGAASGLEGRWGADRVAVRDCGRHGQRAGGTVGCVACGGVAERGEEGKGRVYGEHWMLGERQGVIREETRAVNKGHGGRRGSGGHGARICEARA